MLQRFKSKDGFTLVELLVVIAIIGILATIVLVSLSSARAKARDATRQSNINQIALAMEMYNDNNGSKYLTSASMPTAIGTYLTSVPLDPNGGSYAWVDNTGAGDDQKYLVCATLETGGYIYATETGTKTATSGSCPTALE